MGACTTPAWSEVCTAAFTVFLSRNAAPSLMYCWVFTIGLRSARGSEERRHPIQGAPFREWAACLPLPRARRGALIEEGSDATALRRLERDALVHLLQRLGQQAG